jgi:phosphate/sulfate permease
MSDLVAELLLRLVKPTIATVLGALVFVSATALGEPASVTLALISWLVGAGLVLLVENGLV